MPGYFTDGVVDVELGQHVWAADSTLRNNVNLCAWCHYASLMDSGGGILTLEVGGQRCRANRGDAERYMFELFAALATSGAGTLGIEDERGYRAVYRYAACVGATGGVLAANEDISLADMRFDFYTAEKSAEGAWGAVPAAPGPYGGTGTLQDYTAGGVALGDFPTEMRIEMRRNFPMRVIPRARGARARGPASCAQMAFSVTTALHEAVDSLPEAMSDLYRTLGPRAVALAGNGNTFDDVILDSASPEFSDRHHAGMTIQFLQEIA